MASPSLDLVHQRIRIQVKDDGSARAYPSRIEDVVGQRLAVAMPMERGSYVPLRQGQPVTVFLEGSTLAYRYFETEVTGTNMQPTPLLLLRLPNQIKRLERRQYTRVDVEIAPRSFTFWQDGEQKPMPVVIINLSGGGLMLQGEEVLPEGMLFDAFFELPRGFGVVQVRGRVVRSQQRAEDPAPTYGIGASFINIRYTQRENIIKFVLSQQAQLIRQGVI
ncbi:MAG: flagellar brake protein [Chloroflexota bacterium]|nr:flagellar brake protein [Chloroflexota bacterium]